MATLQNVQIFPAIGIARLGNSPEWYIGPELPFPALPVPPPDGTYKDDACRVKRQAQRFRLWGFFSDGTERELTLADGKITWTAHLVNAKPTFHAQEPSIDGGLKTLDTPGTVASFAGTYAGVSVPLGDAEMDSEGRLIVRGGFGNSANPTDPSSQISDFFETAGWHDDVSDGPITATIEYDGQPFTAADGAWVICPPPRYAPSTYSITSLYDTIRQVAIQANQLPTPGVPSFARDIYPILNRALAIRRVTAFAFGPDDHDSLSAFSPPGGSGDTLAARQAVYQRLQPAGDMPLLNVGDTPSQLQDFQHSFMQQWSQGQETSDWPPVVPVEITAEGLTQAALENCVGASFFPGIEAGGIPPNLPNLKFAEAFRFDHASVQPGEVTQQMARPWQADFIACSGPENDAGVDSASWWPAARPIGVYPADEPSTKRLWTLGVASSANELVENWHELGFIVDPGTGLAVETEKTNVCKSCLFINNRSEISKEEAQALIDSHERITDGLFVVVQGLAPSDLGITTPHPTQTQLDAWAPQIGNPVSGTMTITPVDMELEDDGHLGQAQRITFGYDIAFTTTTAFDQEDVPETITASVLGLSTTTTIDLTTRQHPYMVAGATTWLNADTRVFKLQSGGMFAGQTLGSDPNGFITDVIDSLRSSPQANSWLDALPSDEQGAQLEWSEKLNGQPVYNFAICRVRYRAEMSDAPNVRVFFRLFPAMTTSTDFQPATTYMTGGQPGTMIPLLGIVAGETTTIPFFAAKRGAANVPLNLQQDPKNVETLKDSPAGDETYCYFGCWLDINQPGDKRFPINPSSPAGPFTGPEPLQSIADLIRGTHQCLVAEINFAPDPIPVGSSTAACDRLAQRNLSIDYSDNPGAAATHRVQHTFSIRPTTSNPAPRQGPDELMIDWGATPLGTVATVYLPGVSAFEVMRLADRLYSRNRLTVADANTVRMELAGGVSYVPIPAGGIGDLAGLLTLDLPPTVRAGEVFRIVVHQVVDTPPTLLRPVRDTPPRPSADAAPEQRRVSASSTDAVSDAATERAPRPSRHIVGSYQYSVLVQARAEIAAVVQRAHTNLERATRTVPVENRWYPVMQRYFTQVAEKVTALGGTVAGAVKPGDDDPERVRHEGKVAGIRYDSFGEFEGFWLKTEHGDHVFSTREPGMERTVTRAWREHIAVLVIALKDTPHSPLSLVLLRAPDEHGA
jgi:hypothetical protein